MSQTVIKFENLSKLYRLGEVGTGTISHDLNRWWRMNILGQPDPYTKVGHTNDRSAKAEKGEVVWALKDIDFEVKEGEVLGIIGKNGAGKSTLLKILSKVTSPTTGCIKVKGRIASLLEVGTGFNPEMTGRENIYINGTIMGMRKWEIDKKFDEIVDFAGVAKYIDTPVKRYSSGMTVRLGFAVAAFLEPEILVVDEVLAVGDAEFQKKALGKMQEVSQKQGRTVLFVSHNMPAIQNLCTNGIILHNGGIDFIGSPEMVVGLYLKDNYNLKEDSRNKNLCFIKQWKIENSLDEHFIIKTGQRVKICLEIFSSIEEQINIGMAIYNEDHLLILASNSIDDNSNPIFIEKGKNQVLIEFIFPVKTGNYYAEFSLNSLENIQYDRFQSSNTLIIISDKQTKLKENWRGILEKEVIYKKI